MLGKFAVRVWLAAQIRLPCEHTVQLVPRLCGITFQNEFTQATDMGISTTLPLDPRERGYAVADGPADTASSMTSAVSWAPSLRALLGALPSP